MSKLKECSACEARLAEFRDGPPPVEAVRSHAGGFRPAQGQWLVRITRNDRVETKTFYLSVHRETDGRATLVGWPSTEVVNTLRVETCPCDAHLAPVDWPDGASIGDDFRLETLGDLRSLFPTVWALVGPETADFLDAMARQGALVCRTADLAVRALKAALPLYKKLSGGDPPCGGERLAPDGSNLKAALERLRQKDPYGRHLVEHHTTRAFPDDREFFTSDASDGSLRAAFVLTFLLESSEDTPAFVDELDMSADLRAACRLVGAVREVSRRSTRHVVLATRSPAVLNQFSADQVFVAVRRPRLGLAALPLLSVDPAAAEKSRGRAGPLGKLYLEGALNLGERS